MSDTSILQAKAPVTHSQPLACRLRPTDFIGRNGPVPHVAELELQNLSASDLQIEYQMAVLQYLNLIVRDANCKIISDHHYGDRFSPFEKAKILCLAPGEKFRANVNLFATVSHKPISPGTYTVQAVYEYNTCFAESEPVEVTIKASK
jgi:hypothetical protein